MIELLKPIIIFDEYEMYQRSVKKELLKKQEEFKKCFAYSQINQYLDRLVKS